MLVFLEQTDLRSSPSAKRKWKLLCDCGNLCFAVPQDISNGTQVSCGCYSKKVFTARKHDPIISSALCVWRSVYKDISFDDFYKLSQLPCFYCKMPPSNNYNTGKVPSKNRPDTKTKSSENQIINGDFVYNGLDRIDSDKNHTTNNCVPCCMRCNQAKNNMTLDEFITHIKKMYEGTKDYLKD